MMRSPPHHTARRRAFITITPRQRASEVIATFVGVLERLEQVASSGGAPPGARRPSEQRR